MSDSFIEAKRLATEQLVWGERRTLSSPDLTGSSQMVVLDVSLHAGACHSFHRHPEQEEVLIVISGTVEQWVAERHQMLSGGDLCFIPRDTVHASFNDSADAVRLLAVLSPSIGESGHTLVDMSTVEPWVSLR